MVALPFRQRIGSQSEKCRPSNLAFGNVPALRTPAQGLFGVQQSRGSGLIPNAGNGILLLSC
jgi:hypothetical protein